MYLPFCPPQMHQEKMKAKKRNKKNRKRDSDSSDEEDEAKKKKKLMKVRGGVFWSGNRAALHQHGLSFMKIYLSSWT